MFSIPPRDGPRILRHLYRVSLADVARELHVSPARAAQLERARPGSPGTARLMAAILSAAARRENGDE